MASKQKMGVGRRATARAEKKKQRRLRRKETKKRGRSK